MHSGWSWKFGLGFLRVRAAEAHHSDGMDEALKTPHGLRTIHPLILSNEGPNPEPSPRAETPKPPQMLISIVTMVNRECRDPEWVQGSFSSTSFSSNFKPRVMNRGGFRRQVEGAGTWLEIPRTQQSR